MLSGQMQQRLLLCGQAVGMRACYLFSRLVKVLRQNLRPLLPDVLLRLQPHLAAIVAAPVPDSAPRRQRRARRGTSSSA